MLQSLSKTVDVLTLYMVLQLVPTKTSSLRESERSCWLTRKWEQEVSHLYHTQEIKPAAPCHSDARGRPPGSLNTWVYLTLGSP